MPERRPSSALVGYPAPMCYPSLRSKLTRSSSETTSGSRSGPLICAAYRDRDLFNYFTQLAALIALGVMGLLSCIYTVAAGSVALTETFGAVLDAAVH